MQVLALAVRIYVSAQRRGPGNTRNLLPSGAVLCFTSPLEAKSYFSPCFAQRCEILTFRFGVSWGLLGPPVLGPPGASCGLLGPPGASWTLLGPPATLGPPGGLLGGRKNGSRRASGAGEDVLLSSPPTRVTIFWKKRGPRLGKQSRVCNT